MLILCVTLLYVNHYSFLNVQSSLESSAIVLTCSLVCPLTLHSHQILDRETKVLVHKAIVNQKNKGKSEKGQKEWSLTNPYLGSRMCCWDVSILYNDKFYGLNSRGGNAAVSIPVMPTDFSRFNNEQLLWNIQHIKVREVICLSILSRRQLGFGSCQQPHNLTELSLHQEDCTICSRKFLSVNNLNICSGSFPNIHLFSNNGLLNQPPFSGQQVALWDRPTWLSKHTLLLRTLIFRELCPVGIPTLKGLPETAQTQI